MWRKIRNIQQWLARNRLLLWWLVFVPAVALIIVFNIRYLTPDPNDVANPMLSLQFKIFNSTLLIILARIIVVALGVVIIMICLLFPVLQVGKEGIQWTKELEEELTEVTGEEIREIVNQESWRWSLISGWLRLRRARPRADGGPAEQEFAVLVHDLLNTLAEAFRSNRLSLKVATPNQHWAVLHPLMPRLITTAQGGTEYPARTLGMEIEVTDQFILHMNVYAPDSAGFSKVDEEFMLVLSELFLRDIDTPDLVPENCFAGFELISLTPERGIV